ncbi:flagellar hook-length control protein FliK [Shewanella sp.]|nr:flagellar hook-length control protein FliK [Shewanella sp.]
MQQLIHTLFTRVDGAATHSSMLSQPELIADNDDFSAALDKASQAETTVETQSDAVEPQQRTDAEQGVADAERDEVSQVLAQIQLAQSQSAETFNENAKDAQAGIEADTEIGTEISTEIDTRATLTDGENLPLGQNQNQNQNQSQNQNQNQSQSQSQKGEPLSLSNVTLGKQPHADAALSGVVTHAPVHQSSDVDSSLAQQHRNNGIGVSLQAAPNTPGQVNPEAANHAGQARAEVITRTADVVDANMANNITPQEGVDGNKDKHMAPGLNATVESLKAADLSVKLSPIQQGLTAGLDSGASSDALSALESKSVSAGQSESIGAQSLTRAEPQQIQLALKQYGDQASQMQAMIQRFSPVMKQQLITMVSQGIQQAEIRLDPAELGSMIVRIQVQGDSTQVQFQVAQAQTRELVEQALPRLRDMLAEQGMQLTEGQVSQDHRGGDSSAQQQGDAQGQYLAEMDDFSAEEPLIDTNQVTSTVSAIDYYA